MSVQGAVNICLLSWTKEDEAGRRYAWYPAEDMARLLGVSLKSVNGAIRRLKERGIITVKENGRKGRCTEYYLNANVGALNQPKEKALTIAVANAEKAGCALSSFNEPQTSDPIIPVQSIEHVENRRYPPANSSRSEIEKPVSIHTSMRREQYEALINSGAFKSGNWNV